MARTKGAKNKRSVGIPAELRDALGHRDPAVVLGEIYSMDHNALAKMVRSAAGARAVALRMQAATAAMPYAHSKMPGKVTVDDERLPTLVIDRQKHQMIENKGQLPDVLGQVSDLKVSQNGQAYEVQGESDE